MAHSGNRAISLQAAAIAEVPTTASDLLRSWITSWSCLARPKTIYFLALKPRRGHGVTIQGDW
jgi:hypothetical protein